MKDTPSAGSQAIAPIGAGEVMGRQPAVLLFIAVIVLLVLAIGAPQLFDGLK